MSICEVHTCWVWVPVHSQVLVLASVHSLYTLVRLLQSLWTCHMALYVGPCKVQQVLECLLRPEIQYWHSWQVFKSEYSLQQVLVFHKCSLQVSKYTVLVLYLDAKGMHLLLWRHNLGLGIFGIIDVTCTSSNSTACIHQSPCLASYAEMVVRPED